MSGREKKDMVGARFIAKSVPLMYKPFIVRCCMDIRCVESTKQGPITLA